MLALAPTSSSGVLVCVDASSGARQWSCSDGASTECGGALCACPPPQGSVLVGCKGKTTLLRVAARRESPVGRSSAPEVLGALAASGDGVSVAGGGEGGGLYLWDNNSGALLVVAKAHYRAVTALAFAGDGAVLVSGSQDGTVHAWDVVSLASGGPVTPLHTVASHRMEITALALTRNASGLVVVSTSRDHTCRVTELMTGRELTVASFSCALLCLAVPLANGATDVVYVGDALGSLHVVDVRTQSHVDLVGKHSRDVTGLVVNYPGSSGGAGGQLISCSLDGTLMWTDLTTRRVIRVSRVDGLAGAAGIRAMVLIASTTTASTELPTSASTSAKKLKQEAVVLAKFKTSTDEPANIPIPCLWNGALPTGVAYLQPARTSFLGIVREESARDRTGNNNNNKLPGWDEHVPLSSGSREDGGGGDGEGEGDDSASAWRSAATDLYHLVCRELLHPQPHQHLSSVSMTTTIRTTTTDEATVVDPAFSGLFPSSSSSPTPARTV